MQVFLSRQFDINVALQTLPRLISSGDSTSEFIIRSYNTILIRVIEHLENFQFT